MQMHEEILEFRLLFRSRSASNEKLVDFNSQNITHANHIVRNNFYQVRLKEKSVRKFIKRLIKTETNSISRLYTGCYEN